MHSLELCGVFLARAVKIMFHLANLLLWLGFFFCCRWLSCCMYEICPHTGSSDRLAIFSSHQFHNVWRKCYFYLFLKFCTTLLHLVEHWFSWSCEKQLFWPYLNLLYDVSVILIHFMYQCHEWQQCIFITHLLRKCLSWYLAWHWWLRTAPFVSCFFLLANCKYSFTKSKENSCCKLWTVQLTWKFIGTELNFLTSKVYH